jgi:phosphoribosylglycinamide formyltransferase-1
MSVPDKQALRVGLAGLGAVGLEVARRLIAGVPGLTLTAVAVRDDDDVASLAARVLDAEHRILVAAVRWFCEDRLLIDGARVRVRNEVAGAEALLVPVSP